MISTTPSGSRTMRELRRALVERRRDALGPRPAARAALRASSASAATIETSVSSASIGGLPKSRCSAPSEARPGSRGPARRRRASCSRRHASGRVRPDSKPARRRLDDARDALEVGGGARGGRRSWAASSGRPAEQGTASALRFPRAAPGGPMQEEVRRRRRAARLVARGAPGERRLRGAADRGRRALPRRLRRRTARYRSPRTLHRGPGDRAPGRRGSRARARR